jgi:hypothetical protein
VVLLGKSAKTLGVGHDLRPRTRIITPASIVARSVGLRRSDPRLNCSRGDKSGVIERLTFRTGDAALTQRLRADRDTQREATIYLLATRPIQEFLTALERGDYRMPPVSLHSVSHDKKSGRLSDA